MQMKLQQNQQGDDDGWCRWTASPQDQQPMMFTNAKCAKWWAAAATYDDNDDADTNAETQGWLLAAE